MPAWSFGKFDGDEKMRVGFSRDRGIGLYACERYVGFMCRHIGVRSA
jgi:hypothetical protein